MSGQFKAFVSEEEVQEQRQRRQAEWEKVRKPDDPVDCPEEETRSLFDQLKANKDVEEREREDESKLRSSVKGLDDEEVQFLNFVSNRQMQIERDRDNEEKSVIEEMKNASVLKVQEKTKEKSAVQEGQASKSSTPAGATSSKNSQKLLLQGAIKRKSTESNPDAGEESSKRRRSSGSDDPNDERPDAKLMAGIPRTNGTTMVVAGILPGIADYADDDSSTENESNSSDSEGDHKIAMSTVTHRVVQEMVQKLKEGADKCGSG